MVIRQHKHLKSQARSTSGETYRIASDQQSRVTIHVQQAKGEHNGRGHPNHGAIYDLNWTCSRNTRNSEGANVYYEHRCGLSLRAIRYQYPEPKPSETHKDGYRPNSTVGQLMKSFQ